MIDGAWALWLVIVFAHRGPAECAVDPSKTTVYGSGLEAARAGDLSTFWVQLRDSAGEPFGGGGPENQISVECVTVGKPGFCVEEPQYDDQGNGLWRVDYTVGGVHSTWVQPIFRTDNGGQPVDDQFYFQGDHTLQLSVGYPLTKAPIEIRPKFEPEYNLYPGASNLHMQMAQPYRTGKRALIADFTQLRDRFGNMVRRSNITLQLEPKMTLIERETVGQLAKEHKDPQFEWDWAQENWYLRLFAYCFTVGRYKFELQYRYDERTTESIRIQPNYGEDFVSDLEITLYPGNIDVDSTKFSSNWTADTGAGDTVAVEIQSMDAAGNGAYLIYWNFPFARYTLADQDADLTAHLYFDGELVRTQTANHSTEVAGLATTVITTDKPGNYTLNCELNYLRYPAYTLYFKPLEPDPAHSFYLGDPSYQMQAGGSRTMELQLNDRYDKPAAGDVRNLACTPVSMDFHGNVEFAAAGSPGAYEMRLDGFEVVGQYACQVEYNFEALEDGVVSVEIVPAELDASRSTVSGTGMGREVGNEHLMEREMMWMPAGQSLSLFVQAVDRFGNQITEGDPGFSLNSEFQQICDSFSRKGELGLTRFVFSIETKGIYHSKVTSGDDAVVWEARLEIIPTGVTHTKCSIEGFEDIVAGDHSVGVLKIRDKYGNSYQADTPVETEQFRVTVMSQSETHGVLSAVGQIGEFNGAAGGYSVSFRLTAADTYNVRAQWEDWPLGVAELTVEVFPGPVSGKDSILKAVKQTSIAGEFVSASIEGLDEFANRVTQLDFDGTVTAAEAEGDDNPQQLDYQIQPSSSKPWMSMLFVNFTKAGRYDVWVTLAGESVLESPLRGLEILPGEFDLSKSQVQGQGTTDALVNSWNSVSVTAKDRYDNPLGFSSVDGHLELTVQGSAPVEVAEFRHEASSTYVGAYRPAAEGSLLLTVSFKRIALPGYPRRLEIANPSEAHPAYDMEAYATAASVSRPSQPDGNDNAAEPPHTHTANQELPDDSAPAGAKSDDDETDGCPNLDCGDNGYQIGCDCVCYLGWSTSLQTQDADGKPCDMRDLSPAPAPAPSQIEEEEIEFALGGDVHFSQYAAAAGVGAVVFVLACICCCSSSDSSSDTSSSGLDSSESFPEFPTVYNEPTGKDAACLCSHQKYKQNGEYIPSVI